MQVLLQARMSGMSDLRRKYKAWVVESLIPRVGIV